MIQSGSSERNKIFKSKRQIINQVDMKNLQMVQLFKNQAENLKQSKKSLSSSSFSRLINMKKVLKPKFSQLKKTINKQDQDYKTNPEQNKQAHSDQKMQINQQTNKAKHTQDDDKKIQNSQSLFSRTQTIPNFLQMTSNIRFQQRLNQSKKHIMQNKIRILQRQTNFKLQKKVKQNAELQQKQSILKEIIYERMQRDRQQQKNKQQRKAQYRFIRESNHLKVEITKSRKAQNDRQQKRIRRMRSQQSLLNMQFKRYLQERQKLTRQQEIAYRIQFLNMSKPAKLVTTPSPVQFSQRHSIDFNSNIHPYSRTLLQMYQEPAERSKQYRTKSVHLHSRMARSQTNTHNVKKVGRGQIDSVIQDQGKSSL